MIGTETSIKSPARRRARMALCLGVAALGVGFALCSTPANAQERESPLVGQPAVRQRLLLRKFRLEIAPIIGFSLLGEYTQTIYPGAKIAFHFNDYIGIQAWGFYGLSLDAGLTGQIESVYQRNSIASTGKCSGKQFLNCLPTTDPESAQAGNNTPGAFKDRLARVNGHFGAGVNLSPFFGKMALFGRIFFQYDIYALVGVGIVNYTNNYKGAAQFDPQNTGAKVGPNFGAGLHLFFNNWFALNLEFRDTIVKNNNSGGDANGDFKVNSDDQKILNEFIASIGFSFYLPPSVSLTP
jgi:outer membrane beta-barrel protein